MLFYADDVEDRLRYRLAESTSVNKLHFFASKAACLVPLDARTEALDYQRKWQPMGMMFG